MGTSIVTLQCTLFLSFWGVVYSACFLIVDRTMHLGWWQSGAIALISVCVIGFVWVDYDDEWRHVRLVWNWLCRFGTTLFRVRWV